MTRVVVVFFLFLSSACFAQSVNDYRSIASGDWGDVTIWQIWNGSAWVAATVVPDASSEAITISNPDIVFISAATTADQLVIDAGGSLTLADVLTLSDGPGIDLTINGELTENTIPLWSAGATWLMGVNGTLIRSTSGPSNTWQTNYDGGIATIPATSNWIIRRNTAIPVYLSSTNPATGSVYPNLTIENYISGIWTYGSAFTGSTAYVTVKGTFDLGGAGTSTVDFEVDNTQTPYGVLFMGDVNIRSGNRLRNNGNSISIMGNLTVNGTLSYSTFQDLRLSGVSTQTISGTGALGIYNLYLDCGVGGNIVLTRPITIKNLCTFIKGIVTSSSANLFILDQNAIITGASSNSFVDGPVQYKNVVNISFPVGKSGIYRPITIPYLSSSGTVWTVEYFDSDPGVAFGSALVPVLDHISQCEYWVLSYTGTTPSNEVSLSWDVNSCGVTLVSDLRIARWNGSVWQDYGNFLPSGNTTSGALTTAFSVSNFGAFTLASISAQNPLPVELLAFDVHYNGQAVDLFWTTASEQNNAFFTVERSVDGENYTEVLRKEGAGNSTTMLNYTSQDASPLNGVSYYRLKQTDYNGQFSYSTVKTVDIANKNSWQIETLVNNEQSTQLTISNHELPLAVEVFNLNGQLVYRSTLDNGITVLTLETSGWAAGYYSIRLRDGFQQQTRSFILR
jgi:hypothetical protein